MFYNDIDTRSCTKKVQSLQLAADPCIVKIIRDLGIGQVSKVSVDAGLERLKVISCWEDGGRNRVPVSRCHRNKRIGECVRSISNLRAQGCLILENRVFRANEAFGGIIDFISSEKKSMVISTKKRKGGDRSTTGQRVESSYNL